MSSPLDRQYAEVRQLLDTQGYNLSEQEILQSASVVSRLGEMAADTATQIAGIIMNIRESERGRSLRTALDTLPFLQDRAQITHDMESFEYFSRSVAARALGLLEGRVLLYGPEVDPFREFLPQLQDPESIPPEFPQDRFLHQQILEGLQNFHPAFLEEGIVLTQSHEENRDQLWFFRSQIYGVLNPYERDVGLVEKSPFGEKYDRNQLRMLSENTYPHLQAFGNEAHEDRFIDLIKDPDTSPRVVYHSKDIPYLEVCIHGFQFCYRLSAYERCVVTLNHKDQYRKRSYYQFSPDNFSFLWKLFREHIKNNDAPTAFPE